MELPLLSTAYLAPVQYYCKLYAFGGATVDIHEHYRKQTYRNRCIIASANGPQALTVPVDTGAADHCPTHDVRISDHGNWRHVHWQALVSAYGTTPYFDYLADDFAPLYERRFEFLIDWNERLADIVCRLIDLSPLLCRSSAYRTDAPLDYRDAIRPKHAPADPSFRPAHYYQVFAARHGFLPNLSIIDLLFNMGPEALLVIRDSIALI